MEKKMDIERRVYSAEEIQEILGIKRKILMPGCVAKRNKKIEKSLEKAADYAEKSFEKVVCDG